MMWVQGLACGALLAFAAPTALMLAVLFAPALLCTLAEAGPNRGMPRAVLLGCAAAALGPTWRLWLSGGHMEQALTALSNPQTLVLAWGSGACAWACCQVLPVIIRGIWEVREATRSRAIQAVLKELREAWTLDAE